MNSFGNYFGKNFLNYFVKLRNIENPTGIARGRVDFQENCRRNVAQELPKINFQSSCKEIPKSIAKGFSAKVASAFKLEFAKSVPNNFPQKIKKELLNNLSMKFPHEITKKNKYRKTGYH